MQQRLWQYRAAGGQRALQHTGARPQTLLYLHGITGQHPQHMLPCVPTALKAKTCG